MNDIYKDLVDVCLIQIDVQGHELMVLEGGRDIILRFKRAILIEFDNKNRNKATLKILELLKALNYIVFLPEDQTAVLAKEALSHREGYFDCVYSNMETKFQLI